MDCGVGMLSDVQSRSPSSSHIVPQPKWTPPPDEVGRAFLRSVPPAPRLDAQERIHGRFDPRTLTYADGTTQAEVIRQQVQEEENRRRYVAEAEMAWQTRSAQQGPMGYVMHLAWGAGMVCERPEMQACLSAGGNTKRHSDEDGTC